MFVISAPVGRPYKASSVLKSLVERLRAVLVGYITSRGESLCVSPKACPIS